FSDTPSNTAQQWTEIYAEIFKPAFEECGYICERAQAMTGYLLESIIEKLVRCPIVLADVTDRNPNVFYELGQALPASGHDHRFPARRSLVRPARALAPRVRDSARRRPRGQRD